MQIIEDADSIRLIAEKDFLVAHAGELQAQMLKGLQNASTGNVVLDLKQISHMDSIGIKLVIGLFKTCQNKGLVFQVEASSPAILKLFQICKLNELLDIREVAANG